MKPFFSSRPWLTVAAGGLALASAVSPGAMAIPGPTAAAVSEPATDGAPPLIRRLSEAEYRQAIAQVFGDDIKFGGRFELEPRENGLVAIGLSSGSVSPASAEQYDGMARAIAAQVTDAKHRGLLIDCKPASSTEPDDACAARFFTRVGGRLMRRPLTQPELDLYVHRAHVTAQAMGDFYQGLASGLAVALVSPSFMFRIEQAEPDPHAPGKLRLDAYSLASRLSYMLWDGIPDDELLAAAADGSLQDRATLVAQVDRMLASPKLEGGLRAFFSDMLMLKSSDFASATKDPDIYSGYTGKVAEDAREQALRTILDQVMQTKSDYRDLYTRRTTFMSRELGSVYRVPVAREWEKVELPADQSRAGLQTLIAFTALHAQAGRSSATLRGKALRQLIFCENIPDPPPNVDFKAVNEIHSLTMRTARDRLAEHSTNPACAGCHRLMDPIGLALENFDGAGAFREQENGAVIDASGKLGDRAFHDPVGLAQAIHDYPGTTSCLVQRLYSYGVGRSPTNGEAAYLQNLNERFASEGYDVKALLRTIVLSEAFKRMAPEGTVATTRVAAG